MLKLINSIQRILMKQKWKDIDLNWDKIENNVKTQFLNSSLKSLTHYLKMMLKFKLWEKHFHL